MTKDNIFNSNQIIQSAAGKLQQLATNHILRTQEQSVAPKTLGALDIQSVLVLLKNGYTADLAHYSRMPHYRDYTAADFELFEDKIVTYITKEPGLMPTEFVILTWNKQGVQLKGPTTIWVTYAELRTHFEAVCTNATDHVLGVRLPDRVDEGSSADHKTTHTNPNIRVEWDSSEAPTAVRELMETAAEIASNKNLEALS